jgi:nitroimidazol reductase NimA-like FMN-containing flavoprotein (pyridoxamine 5'-phosphate oxidase superfamily)
MPMAGDGATPAGAPGRLLTPDPLTELAIRDGHRRLLEVFKDFVPFVPNGELDPNALQGLVAFLRQSVLPFARWEEGRISPGTDLAEDLAFEHAFLAIEIDALARSAAHLAAAATPEERATAEAATWRRLYRLEGIFELHASKLEDRPLTSTAECFAAPVEVRREKSASLALAPERINAFLRSRSWGLLSTQEPGSAAPYAVPVSFGWDGGSAYLACSPGRKTQNLEREPEACLTVVEVASGASWTSVVVRGPVRWVTGPVDRLRAAGWIHRQRAATPVDPHDLLRFSRARIARLEPLEITGRTRG